MLVSRWRDLHGDILEEVRLRPAGSQKQLHSSLVEVSLEREEQGEVIGGDSENSNGGSWWRLPDSDQK